MEPRSLLDVLAPMTDSDFDPKDEEAELDSFEQKLHEQLAPDDVGPGGGADQNGLYPADAWDGVGPFAVEERIGKGGMGTVYRAVHPGTGVPVALKVLHRLREPTHRRQFQMEVQSQAGLHHPGIVHLYEYGETELPEEHAESDAEETRPYVAMELAGDGTLRDAMPFEQWSSVRSIVAQTVDALAHSHARRVIHRDLKPENLLLFDADDAEPIEHRVKLADFGIAHALGEEDTRETDILASPVGTPLYMAPEQFRSEWRRYGPWTDLYSLGCLVWELVCGRPPFGGRDTNFVEFLALHAEAERPDLDPQFPVPEGLEGWLHRAMAIQPDRRFRWAAEALHSLPPAESEDIRSPDASSERANGDDVGRTETETSVQTLPKTIELEPEGTHGAEHLGKGAEQAAGRSGESPNAAGNPVPVPETWKRPSFHPESAHVVGTGLGLFGLREPPFVDRDRERDQIWEMLRDVDADRSPRLVWIVGEAGTGKSRLVEWMGERAEELGAARVVKAVHTPGGSGPNEGLAGMIRRAVRGYKLGREELYRHLLDELPRLPEADIDRKTDARALTEYLEPTDEDAEHVEGPRYRFASADQKTALVARTLRRFGAHEPVFVWLDDVQWSERAVDVLELLAEGRLVEPPALVVATVRAEALAEDDSLERRIQELAERDDAARMELAPLVDEDHREFVDRMLPLEDELAGRLAERTEGNPLFARELLRHLVDQRRLEVGPEGFRLPEGVELELPEDVHAIWMERLERAIRATDPSDHETAARALERAAILGREVGGAEWRALCAQLGFLDGSELREELIERGLARRTESGWSFTHGLFIDSLERRAEECGWREAHHRKCAELLEELYPDRPQRTAARRADHWVEAGELERALEPLLREIRRLRSIGEIGGRLEIVRRRERLLDQLNVPEDDPRRIENEIEGLSVRLAHGEPLEAVLDIAESARRRSKRIGDDRLAAKALICESRCQRQLGHEDVALAKVRESVNRARQSGDPNVCSRALNRYGWTAYVTGDLALAQEKFSEAREVASSGGGRSNELAARASMAWTALGRGEEEEAVRLFEDVLEEAREDGYRGVEMDCANGLGEVARFRGDADRARRRYRQTVQLARELGHAGDAAMWKFNWAQVELVAGRFDVAAERLRESRRGLERSGETPIREHLLRTAELTLSAGREDWDSFDRLFRVYQNGWPEDARLIKDHPWLLEMAGDYAAEAGDVERARLVWELARDLWEELGNDEAVERLEEYIG